MYFLNNKKGKATNKYNASLQDERKRSALVGKNLACTFLLVSLQRKAFRECQEHGNKLTTRGWG